MENEAFLKNTVHNADINIIKNIINDFEAAELATTTGTCCTNFKNNNNQFKKNKQCKTYNNYLTVCTSEPVISKYKKLETIRRTKTKFNRSLDNYQTVTALGPTRSFQNFLKTDDNNYYSNVVENNKSVDNENAAFGTHFEQNRDEYEKLNNIIKFESITNITRRKLYTDSTKRRQTFMSENVKKASTTMTNFSKFLSYENC